jgi:hypothetical protein
MIKNETGILLKIPLEDNFLIFLPEGIQTNFLHKPEGRHSRFWRVVITFRFSFESKIYQQISKFKQTNPGNIR